MSIEVLNLHNTESRESTVTEWSPGRIAVEVPTREIWVWSTGQFQMPEIRIAHVAPSAVNTK